MSTFNVASPANLSELLPKLDDNALRNFLETGDLPAHIPEPIPEPEPEPESDNDVLPTCPSQVYSRKYGCWLPGWVYKQGYDI